MNSIDTEYVRSHPRCRELAAEQAGLLPDGVAHDCRYVVPFPIFIDYAEGARKWDVDGNEYVCLAMGHGSLILGHAHPEIVAAVQHQVARGTHLGFNSPLETRWAKAIKALVPGIEKLRFHSSGTEATMMALRLSRACTGRSKFIKFTSHFHGWHDAVSVSAAGYTSPGIPDPVRETVIVLPVRDTGALARTLERDGDVAAVILEPTGAKGGALPIPPDLLRQIRRITKEHDTLMIADEIITGFRVSPGGAQGKWGVLPDLTTLGKVAAGGLPGACVGGRADIIDIIGHGSEGNRDPSLRVPHPGTYNANPLSAVAGSTCLEIIASEPIVEKTHTVASRVREEFNRILRAEEVSAFVHGHGSEGFIVFDSDYDGDLGEQCSAPHDEILASLTSAKTAMFRKAMLNNGVDVMNGYWFIFSSVLGEREIEHLVSAFQKSIGSMKGCDLLQERT